MKKWILFGAFFLLMLGGGFTAVRFYSYVFSKTVKGKIVRVERVSNPEAVITQGMAIPSSYVFSFAIAIRDEKGQIHTASSEDRQWAVAQTGQCTEARFFPYPPWKLDKAGTYFGARLLTLRDCLESPNTP